MSVKYDTVVIGAGPSGTACSITLQRRGIKNCLIDKAFFPRRKTCAGLVTGKTYKLINKLFGENDTDCLFCDTASKIRLFQGEKELVSAQIKNPVRLVKRVDFDDDLAKRYKNLGGELFDGETIRRIDYNSNKIKLKSGKTIEYNNLIFADGAISLAHKKIGFDKSKLAFGIEAYIPREELNTDSIDIYFEYIDGGYIWVFPHSDTVCVGAVNQFESEVDYKNILTEFLRDKGVDTGNIKYFGAFLPYGNPVPQNKLPDNVMLIGDAAGFADPISGEGLYMALRSGIAAAEAVQYRNPKKKYLDFVKPLRRAVTDGKKAQKLFYSPVVFKKVLSKAEGKREFVSFFFDNVVEEYNYEYRQVRKMYRDYKAKLPLRGS